MGAGRAIDRLRLRTGTVRRTSIDCRCVAARPRSFEDEALQAQGAAAFRWSPDGGRIAFLMPDPKSESEQKRERDKDDSRVVDKDSRRARVWVLDVATRKMTPVTAAGWQIAQIEWLPDGDRLIASADAKPGSDQWHEHLYAIGLADGRFSEIAAPRGPLGAFAVSPDLRLGPSLTSAPESMVPKLTISTFSRLPGSASANLTGTRLDRPVSLPKWIDNQTVAVHVVRGFTSTVGTIDRNGSVGLVDDLVVNPSSFARTASGTLAYAGETTVRAPELWIKHTNVGGACRVAGQRRLGESAVRRA